MWSLSFRVVSFSKRNTNTLRVILICVQKSLVLYLEFLASSSGVLGSLFFSNWSDSLVKTRGFFQDQVLEWLREGLSQVKGLVYPLFTFVIVFIPSHSIFHFLFILVQFLFGFIWVWFGSLPPTYTSGTLRVRVIWEGK